MTMIFKDSGSFRDSKGHVYGVGEKIYRTILPPGVKDYEFVKATGLYNSLAASGKVIEATEVDLGTLPELSSSAVYLLEHPKIPFISYPYEWSFQALKSAALLHLDIQIEALNADIVLSDASAYNIQFIGSQPIFIDALSFCQYQDGAFWTAHNQFCEQFLNPLLLQSLLGIIHNPWYRGSLEGIPTNDLARLLPLKKKLSWNVLTHVTLQAAFQNKAQDKKNVADSMHKRKLPKASYLGMLRSLHKWISKLQPLDQQNSTWANYDDNNSYNSLEVDKKESFIRQFVKTVQPQVLWDIGCNNGHYVNISLDAGAQSAIGFDFDHMALNLAFERSIAKKLNFLPLFMDAANQAPNQGWQAGERKGIKERASADALLNLAFAHHMIISKNIPMDQFIDWLLEFAGQGIVEFVPKNDPMVQELLLLREDIFPDYDLQSFTSLLLEKAEIIDSQKITENGRTLIWYKRHEETNV